MKKFGDCCAELRDTLEGEFEHLLRQEDNGVLYMSVGYVQTPEGTGWFDSAVLFCPFCGAKLQDKAEIAAQAGKNN